MAMARDDSHWITGVPKAGTAVPNRIFVGGISGNTKEEDLLNLFSKFGIVKSTKIIVDKAGISKGYGFVTFETDEEAQKVLREVDCVTLKERKLNIAPAVKKQPYSRSSVDSNSVPSTSLVWPNQAYSGSSGFARDSMYYPQGSWPIVWTPQLYLQQQCHYPPSAQAGFPHYVYSLAPNDYPFPAVSSVSGSVSGSDYSDSSSADTEVGKNRTKTSIPLSTDYDRNQQSQTKQSQIRTSSPPNGTSSNMEPVPNYMQSTPISHLHPPMFAKTVNGVTVMAYPSSFLMGSPTLVHVKEGSNESENVLTELGFLHSPMVSGTLTPPPTPLAFSCEYNANNSFESLRKN